MNKRDITIKLNIKITFVVALLILSVMANQWLSLNERKKECAEYLEMITEFIVKNLSVSTVKELLTNQGGIEKTLHEQVLMINKEIQPLLVNVLVPKNMIKFGVYSRYHERMVAVGPDFDASLLAVADRELFADTHANMPYLGEQKKSIVWYGAPILYHVRPIRTDGEVIGYVFACANLNQINTEVWTITITMFMGGFIAVLIVVVLFQESIIRLKKDLESFAEKVVKGGAKHFESVVPELNPVLTYITQQTENLARLDRLNIIGEMAASIAHEVRNPMTTVRGFLQYMGGKEEFKSSRERFTLMIEELDRANSIISEFLSLAKNKAMNFQDTNLNKVITDVFPLIQADAFRSNCQIETSLGNIANAYVDESSIRQLILNMVRNAIEAMPCGGTIRIRTVESAQKILLSIQDEGVGISSELLEKLGTPFFTTKEHGTGLGLAVCYRIIERHDASISVESEPGTGTVFTVVFSPIESV